MGKARRDVLAGGKALRFVADAMLGKLAKWLRVLGHDTHYESRYPAGSLDRLAREGRYLLTRDRSKANRHPEAVLLTSNGVGEQVEELNVRIPLATDPAEWFTRCLVCNVLLQEPPPRDSREAVPEYVYYENTKNIRSCPSCGRCYWPGSHRKQMLRQLEKWGLVT